MERNKCFKENTVMGKKFFIDIQKIKQAMLKKGIDEKAMAERMGVTLRTLKRFFDCTDQQNMGLRRLVQLKNALGIPVQELLCDDWKEKAHKTT